MTRKWAQIRTAISGLSANTYSCGGDGSRFGLGGVASLGSKAGLRSTLWKNLRMPWRSSNWISDSSSDGGGDKDDTDESSEESSSAILLCVATRRGRVVLMLRLRGVGCKWKKVRSTLVTEIGCKKLRTGQQWPRASQPGSKEQMGVIGWIH